VADKGDCMIKAQMVERSCRICGTRGLVCLDSVGDREDIEKSRRAARSRLTEGFGGPGQFVLWHFPALYKVGTQ
jgi:hypothetical protein